MKTIAAYIAQALINLVDFIANHLLTIGSALAAIALILKTGKNIIIWTWRIWSWLAKAITPPKRRRRKKSNKRKKRK